MKFSEISSCYLYYGVRFITAGTKLGLRVSTIRVTSQTICLTSILNLTSLLAYYITWSLFMSFQTRHLSVLISPMRAFDTINANSFDCMAAGIAKYNSDYTMNRTVDEKFV
jgi:hypothetical protein